MPITTTNQHLKTLITNQQNLEIKHNLNSKPNNNKNLLNIFYVNIRSLKKKFTDLQHTLEKDNIIYKIVILIETWLKKDDIRFYEIDGYTMHNSVRTRNGGGITIYTQTHNTNTQTNKIIS